MRFSTSAVAAVLLVALSAPRCSAFLAPQPLKNRKQSRHHLHFLPARNVKWQLLSTVEDIEDAISEGNGDGKVTAVDTKESDDEATSDEESTEYKLVLEEVPPASYEITSSPTAPGGGSVHTLTINLGAPGHPDPIVIETGKVGRQASAAVTLTRGDSVLYATASRDNDVRDLNFLPLSVEHQERFSSAGMTSGAFNKRDGRPAEHEILVCRLIDRPLRPLIAEGWRHETQLLSWILSYDGVRTCDPLAITASATALWLSDVPLIKPVAASMVGYIDEQLVLNPTLEQMKHSRLNLIVAGTKDAVLMIEGAADFLPEELMIEAVTFGHNAIKTQCEALEELGKIAGKEKKYDTIKPPVEGLQEMVDEKYTSQLDEIYNSDLSKECLSSATSQFAKTVVTEMEDIFPEEKSAIKNAMKDLMCRRMFVKAKNDGTRIDGRKLDEVRIIEAEVGLFPRVHGSALFTRGQTQVVATATLGDSGMKQKIDKISGLEQKRFYLQYTFPPSW